MTTSTVTLQSARRFARIRTFAGIVAVRAVGFARAWKHRRDMAMLARFDDRMLADIGLTRGDLRDAVSEPVWRDPTTLLVSRAQERRHHRVHLGRPVRLADAPPIAPEAPNVRSRLRVPYY
jgi:uncharacterized protein YjiS (DUF1127 family)